MPFGKEPQFFGKIEQKEEFGQMVEREIVVPYLKREFARIFSNSVHASEKGDKKWKTDEVVQFGKDHSFMGIQSVIWEGFDPETLGRKIKKDLRDIPWVTMEQVYPDPASLPLSKRQELMPKVFINFPIELVEEADSKFKSSNQKGKMIDYLPKKEWLPKEILNQMIKGLGLQLEWFPEKKRYISPKIEILTQELKLRG
ncbi:MAG: hypothetical protein Q7R84_01370 [bacterium]|nr:hypothetical protein [bacterium]